MRRLHPFVLCTLLSLPSLSACAGRTPYPTVDGDGLALDSVVLYRNGVGYFERRGKVDGDALRLRVRKDQVNDLLKSLTVVDEDGKAVSVSMPLDPQTWASVAMATLAPGNGSLPAVLDSLRGTEVTVRANNQFIRGRIMMVEHIVNEPDPDAANMRLSVPTTTPDTRDWKLTLLSRGQLEIIRVSKIRGITLHDGDLAMQLHRSLDASAGEGMFEQVDIEIRLVDARSHQLTVSYVVGAPMWKPTYRVVLPSKAGGEALLQGWAVVDNISGEDWKSIGLSLTSGAPISFRYDLHTPREVWRTDMTASAADKQAAVALGETTWGTEEERKEEPAPEPDSGYYDQPAEPAYDYDDDMAEDEGGAIAGGRADKKNEAKGKSAKPKPSGNAAPTTPARRYNKDDSLADGRSYESTVDTTTAIDVDTLRRSTMASSRSQRISGLTRVDLQDPVTVPDGTSTMVALINETVAAEETFLFKPGGAGYGYESNPYRVVRFQNSTPYVMEPGPIAIYSGGSFVGEGLSEAVGAGTSVTIPFAVETDIMVTSTTQYSGQEMTLTRIVRGVLEVESFYQTTTTWDVRGPAKPEKYKVLVRQPQTGSNYELAQRPPGTEDLEGAWLIPIELAANERSATLKVVEQTPSKISLAIWDQQAVSLLEKFLAADNLDAEARKKLQPILDLRRDIGRIDTEVDGLRRQQVELESRAEQTRQNLEAIKKDSAANALRQKLNKKLEEFSSEADALGRKIVELENKRLERKIELEDMIQDLDLRAPMTPGKPGPAGATPAGKGQ